MNFKDPLKFSISWMSVILIAIFSVSALSQAVPDRSREIAGLTPADITARSTRIDPIRKPETATVPTEVYRIGVNDIVRIDLKDVPGVPMFVRVLPDGTIDFPLAGENIVVAGKTTAEAESIISRSIKLISNARVGVHVNERLSHTISVWGLVDQPGEHQIQRDAVPFYVIRAVTAIDTRADRVRITRAVSAKTDEYALSDSSLDSVLVYPGDSIEFADAGVLDK